jgi:sialate O-acetylesterase
MRMKIKLLMSLVAVAAVAQAAVKLGMPFADHMVLQRDKPVAVWGTAAPGEKVEVSFAGQVASATADEKGDWRVNLKPMPASKEGRTLKANDLEVKDVLVGEVWFAGGQSNMGVPLVWVDPRHGDEKGAMIAQYVKRPFVRFARHGASWQAKPVRTGTVEWKELNWENVKSGDGDGSRRYGFSAVAYYFALELYSELGVPIGILASYNGGTNIEAWTPREGFLTVPELHELAEKYPVSKKEWETREKELSRGGIHGGPFRQPGVLWNSNIEPFTPYTIRGAIWYQGENNSGDPEHYCALSHALWNGWSKKFENPNLPFYFAQLAPWGSKAVPAMQEAQSKFAAEQPNSAIAIINDLGNNVDIHPCRKQTVAQRLALHAFKRLYGYTHIQDNSPTLKSWKIEGDKFILSFRDVKRFYVYNMDRSLKVGFEICGEDGQWKQADIQNFRETKDKKGKVSRLGELVGTDIVVSAKGVDKPVKLRYLHSEPWYGALYNEVNLPVGAFHVGD